MGKGQLREMKRVIKPNGVKRDRIGGKCDVQVCSARVWWRWCRCVSHVRFQLLMAWWCIVVVGCFDDAYV